MHNTPRNEVSNGHIVTDPIGLGNCVALADLYAYQHNRSTLVNRKLDLEADSEIERMVQTKLRGGFQLVGSPELIDICTKCADYFYTQYDNVVWGDTLTVEDMTNSQILAKSLSTFKYAPLLILQPHKTLCMYFTDHTDKTLVKVTRALLTAYTVVMEQLLKNNFEGQIYPISDAPKKAQKQ